MLSEQAIWYSILWIIVWTLVWFLISKIRFHIHIRRLQKKSVTQSQRVTLWYVQEKIAPLLPDFPYHIKDLVFLGKWVDYIVFDWLHKGDISSIIFLEIKTWWSSLNANEKLIKQAIDNKRISYNLIRYK
jgi:predicted Holliday junction resolvase-like endonuclease